MLSLVNSDVNLATPPLTPDYAPESLIVEPLAPGAEAEVLTFLAARPLHTVSLAGYVRDNGLVSEHNRGTFYGCRSATGELLGVALIGHAILFEARSEAVLERFAQLARQEPEAFILLGESDQIEQFWTHYAAARTPLHRVCREIFYELRWPLPVMRPTAGLRLATLADLDLIVPVHAQMAQDESGVNPLDIDAEGFRARCARRITLGRTWVLVEQERLLFKADIVSETPEVIYLEGVYVHPQYRQKGLGARCLTNLTRQLLQRADSVCLLVNVQNRLAQAFYEQVGFRQRGIYDTIFLQEKETALPVSAPAKVAVERVNEKPAEALSLSLLTIGQEAEVLTFLAERPLETIFLAGFVRDNGLESKFNNGNFYGCRDGRGRLVGVALIGRITLFEARTPAALLEFAWLAQASGKTRILLGEQASIEQFWRQFASAETQPRLTCHDWLLVQRTPFCAAPVKHLRLATAADLELVLAAHGELCFEENGYDPRTVDPVGFRGRCVRRIEQDRVWVWIEDRQLIFKADVTSESSAVTYLEGVYVNKLMRGRGYGQQCLAQLGRLLLAQSQAISVLVDQRQPKTLSFYYKTGYELEGSYQKIYLAE